MKQVFPNMLTLWALNDLLRRPATTLLTATVLMLLSLFTGTVLLLNQALDDTAEHLLSRSPAVVIRRLNAGGWSPIPILQAVNAARNVPGVVSPRVRIWGTVAGPNGPLTIMAVDEKIKKHLLEQGLSPPNLGQAIIGGGILPKVHDDAGHITLSSEATLQLDVIATLPRISDMATYHLVLTTPQDARRLLNIPQKTASDLVLDVFHENEAEALKPELAIAFPWPVHIVLRQEAMKRLSSGFAAQGALSVTILIPAILAMVLLIAAGGKEILSRRSEAGLLRSLGWTTRDLARLQLLRSTLISIPSVTSGILLAYIVTFRPGIRWIGFFFLNWTHDAPAYYLSSIGAGLIAAEVFTLIVMPYILASMWPVLILATQTPLSLLKGDFYR